MTVQQAGAGASIRVLRGACWSYDAWYCRSANRGGNVPGYRGTSLGFRPARRFPPKSLTIYEMKP